VREVKEDALNYFPKEEGRKKRAYRVTFNERLLIIFAKGKKNKSWGHLCTGKMGGKKGKPCLSLHPRGGQGVGRRSNLPLIPEEEKRGGGKGGENAHPRSQ